MARVIGELGGRAVAAFTQGGSTGALLATLLERDGVSHQALAIAQDTRESFTVMEEQSGGQYRFVLPGPTLSPKECERMLAFVVEQGTTEVVLVSMGARGARLVSANLDQHFVVPPVKPVSRVGAGDSTVGGLVYALSCGRDLERAAAYGVAAGTAAVLTPGTELCTKADTERLFAQIRSYEPS